MIDSLQSPAMNPDRVNISKLLYEIDMPELQCKFYVYNLTPPLAQDTRLYVQIEYTRMYDGIYYLPYMEVEYTEREYEESCSTLEKLTENLHYHFTAAHIMTRELDEYFH